MHHPILETLNRLTATEQIPLLGITDAHDLEEPQRIFIKWLANGRQAEMDWLARNPADRFNPAAFFKGARSIAMFGFPYFSPETRTAWPRISRYALGRDYHIVVKEKLSRVLRGLQRVHPQIEGRICVDSEPLPERTLAARAGLGWIGHNACLINTRFGSYFFLGELVLNVELPATDPVQTQCGECRRCLAACPTQAIVESGLIDCRRCLAYLTIENHGVIPRQFKEKLGGWLFGCDLCQEACPYNNQSLPLGLTELRPHPAVSNLVPGELLALSGKAFLKQLGFTPLRRAGRRGLLRNLAALLPECPDHQAAISYRHGLISASSHLPMAAAQLREFSIAD